MEMVTAGVVPVCGVHSKDFWSPLTVSVPSFFLYDVEARDMVAAYPANRKHIKRFESS